MWYSYKIKNAVTISEMYSLFEAHHDSSYIFPGESHNFWECMYVIDGAVCASGDERIYNMKKNEIIFHKPLEMHKFHIEDPKGANLLIFSFSMSGEASEFFKNKVFSLNEEQTDIIKSFLNFLRNSNSFNKNQLHLQYLNGFGSSLTYSQTVVNYIYRLFLSLCNDSNISPTLQSSEAKIFYDAVNYMNINISSSPSIDEIAEVCNISSTGLKKTFTKYSGISIHKYFVTLKINTASQMLKDGVGVTEISEKLGFSSQGYFSFVFKRETGFSPTEYKYKAKAVENTM